MEQCRACGAPIPRADDGPSASKPDLLDGERRKIVSRVLAFVADQLQVAGQNPLTKAAEARVRRAVRVTGGPSHTIQLARSLAEDPDALAEFVRLTAPARAVKRGRSGA